MLIISCNDMKAIDNYAINTIGIPSIILMENAALRVVANIDLENTDSYTIVCGVGNNGGDGLAIARHLVLKDKLVKLFIIGNLDKGSEDFNVNLNILNNLDIGYTHIVTDEDLIRLQNSITANTLTIDCIFGIGLARKIKGLFYKTIQIINSYSNHILSVDIPSGLNGDTGKVLGISVQSHKTITFHRMKKGMVDKEAYTGEIIVEDIGIPIQATKACINSSKDHP